jgi:hypothetical protein
MRYKRAWTMPADEARTFLQQLQEKIASSDIEVAHRDVLIRLRSIIEEDLEAESSGSEHCMPFQYAHAAFFCHWGWGFKSERVCLVSGGHASVRDRC